MNCHECRDLLSPYLDNMTSEVENKRITVHLASCSSCYREMQEMMLMLEGLSFFKGEVPLPAGYKEELSEKLLAYKTSLRGRQQMLPTPRTGGWIAASVAAIALSAGIWLSSFMPVVQVADMLQNAVPAVFDRDHQQVKPEVEKIIAKTADDMARQQNAQNPNTAVTPAGNSQVALNDPAESQTPPKQSGNQNNAVTPKPATVAPAAATITPKVLPVVTMQVAVENLDTAVHLLRSEADSQNAMVAVSNVTGVQTLAAGRDKIVTVQVPQAQLEQWTSMVKELGSASSPSRRDQDVTQEYIKLSEQAASLQQQLASAAPKDQDQLKDQLTSCQKQLDTIKSKLNLVTINIKLHEDVTP